MVDAYPDHCWLCQSIRPTIVTLIGSSRFPHEHADAMRRETLAGRIVIPLGLYGHTEGLDMHGSVKAQLDELHLARIDLADEVLVVAPACTHCLACEQWVFQTCLSPSLTVCPACNANRLERKPYIGESSRREIAHARARGKKVRWTHGEVLDV